MRAERLLEPGLGVRRRPLPGAPEQLDRERVLERLARWREICPDLTLRSTFIVGFPGETDADFEDTMTLIDAIGFEQM